MSNLLKTLQRALEYELTNNSLDVYDVEVTCNGFDIDVDYFDVSLDGDGDLRVKIKVTEGSLVAAIEAHGHVVVLG